MYGTVARMRVKAGMEQRMMDLMHEFEGLDVPGSRHIIVYRMDANPNEYMMAVVFDSRDAYMANAASPEQDARYREYREFLDSDPEWHDGEIVYPLS